MIVGSGNPILGAASSGYPVLLDDFPNAEAAYSVRLLRTAYTGFCMEVRRSSDNTTQDIGFSDGYLDTAALLSFVGAGNGFVRTWYDQSGNGRNAQQTTTNFQPRIVSSGVVDTVNSIASLLFSSSLTNAFSLTSTFNMDATNYSCFIANKLVDGTSNGMYIGNTANNSNGLVTGRWSSAVIYNKKPSQQGRQYTSSISSAFHLYCGYSDGASNADCGIRENGNERTTTDAGLTTNATATIATLGSLRLASTTRFSNAYCSELVFYNGVDKSADFANIEANIMGYYGIT